MAEDDSESIGGVSVKVTGDFSQADAAFDAAVARYVEAGHTLAEALNLAFADVPEMASAAAAGIDKMGIAAANAAANVREFGSALDATGENVENAGENFGRFREKATSGIQGVISEIRVLRAAMFLIWGPEMVARLVEGLVETLQKEREAISTSVLSWREYNEALAVTDTQIKLSNAELENQIARIEHRPQNNIKVALLEIAEAGEKMALELDKDFDALDKHLKEAAVGVADLLHALTNRSLLDGITELGQVLRQTFSHDIITDLHEKIKDLQAQFGGFTDSAHQMALLRKEADVTLDAINKLYAQPRTNLIQRQIQDLERDYAHLQAQIERTADAQKNAQLKAQTETETPDSGKVAPFGTAGGEAAIQLQMMKDAESEQKELIKDIAHYDEALFAHMIVLRQSGESMADWTKRNNEAKAVLAGEPPLITDLSNTLRAAGVNVRSLEDGSRELQESMKALSPGIMAANAQWAAFGKAVRDLHLHDTDEQLVQMAHDLDAIAAMSGKASADYVLGFQKMGAAAAAASVQTGDFESRLAGLAYQQVPSIFSNIESQLASDLVHWKNWYKSIEDLFRGLAQDALKMVLQAFLQPVEQALQKTISEFLSKLSSAFASAGAATAQATAQIQAAAAEAYAWTYASVSAIPIVGPGLAPEAADAAYAAVMAMAPAAEQGLDYVPKEGLYHLHEGERVASKQAAAEERLEKSVEARTQIGKHHEMHRALEGVDHIPHAMPVMVDEGERILTRESNAVLSRLLDMTSAQVPSVGPSHYNNSSTHGDVFDFRGANFHGFDKRELADMVFNEAVKRGRRANVQW